jgi:hypothetical protein
MSIFKKSENDTTQPPSEPSPDSAPAKVDPASAAEAAGKNEQDPAQKNATTTYIKIKNQLQELAEQFQINERKIKTVEKTLSVADNYLSGMINSTNLSTSGLVFQNFCFVAQSIKIEAFFGKNDIETQFQNVQSKLQNLNNIIIAQNEIALKIGSAFNEIANNPIYYKNGNFLVSDSNLGNAVTGLIDSNIQKKTADQPSGRTQQQMFLVVEAFKNVPVDNQNKIDEIRNQNLRLMSTKRLTLLSGAIQDLQNVCLEMCPIEQKYERFIKRFGEGVPNDLLASLDEGYNKVVECYERMQGLIQPGTVGDQPVGQEQATQIQKAINSSIEIVKNKQADIENAFLSSYFGVKI